MKIIAILLVLSICIGTFSYLDIKSFFTEKIDTVSDAVNDVAGLIGVDDSFRVTANSSDLLNTTLYVPAFGENATIRDCILVGTSSFATDQGRTKDGDIVDVVYSPNLGVDAVNPYIYELVCKIYTANGLYKVTVPCIRFDYKGVDYLIVDPLNDSPNNVGDRFMVEIEYSKVLFKPRFAYVDTNLIEIDGELLYLRPLDLSYDERYRGYPAIKDFLPIYQLNYYQSDLVEGYIRNSLVSVESYCKGEYIYKPVVNIEEE